MNIVQSIQRIFCGHTEDEQTKGKEQLKLCDPQPERTLEYYLTSDELKALLKKTFPNQDIHLGDYNNLLVNEDWFMDKVHKYFTTEDEIYRQDNNIGSKNFDCENFQNMFMVEQSFLGGELCVQKFWATNEHNQCHAMNLFVTLKKEIVIVEPQTYKKYTVQNMPYKNVQYIEG